ncbi:glycolate oxidase subunit GlcE [Halomonas sp. MCCC 1A17488]|uniref:glycolate oxidase subunit GlcE n=1 Tax=unclassified Halomonas TaxID=2609666 RepID=UPI0018D24583|nr:MULTISPECIES: glycolate oxidase subunit GlcE [unclassified Halomonas]MCE8017581.1 glycolate oxidase subunit GlcE [Halomonas sp. MCCC 1A17488]MCG3240914.1 glycolate oxidase subunit GlcE [Halomonas sp. MCCC 1A17488]QPP48786.1 glycolate oxidase subunit GlcE [Halomonas sp. SS10-MC5]
MAIATHLSDHDASAALAERIRQASAEGTPLRIVGGDTRFFYGREVEGSELSTREHCGIRFYDPVELVVSVRAGTPLAELEAALAEHGQMLPFEPPRYGAASTVGGMVATGLSGPRRPWAGSVRDFVLGARVINHEGNEQRFGGEVMKNVAGYDLSRLMVGAQGTLGLITEVSFKVLPIPGAVHSLHLELSLDEARLRLAEWGREPLPISAAAWLDGALHLRLEGGPSSVAATRARIGGDDLDSGFWAALRDQRLPFFRAGPLHETKAPLWRLSLPHRTSTLELPGVDERLMIHDWAGAQRWLCADLDADTLRRACQAAGGHATCYGPRPTEVEPFTPLPEVLMKYHRNLKAQLDPKGLFNPGRLYAAF